MSVDANGELQDDQDQFEHYSFRVDKGQQPLRIDKYLLNRIEGISRNKIQHAIEAESVLVNEKAAKSNYKVRPDDEIRIVLPSPVHEFEILPENIPLKIVYEDDDVLVIDKPAGLVVHPGHGNYTGTLINGLVYYLANLPSTPGNNFRPGLVHRIDKDTSGLLVVAKNDFALAFLAKQFADHTVQRSYRALVWGNFDEKSGTVTGNIDRNQKNRTVMDVFPEGDKGKPAITHFKVLEDLFYVSFIECMLETGRTHQIRTHMKFMGHTLFNDAAYGGNKILKGTVFTRYKQFVENCFSILPRQALHAFSLGFIHPLTKKKMYFESPLPEDFEKVLEKWRTYSSQLKK